MKKKCLKDDRVRTTCRKRQPGMIFEVIYKKLKRQHIGFGNNWVETTYGNRQPGSLESGSLESGSLKTGSLKSMS